MKNNNIKSFGEFNENLNISDVTVSCPECGCDYTYEVGYGFRECFECLNTWKDN